MDRTTIFGTVVRHTDNTLRVTCVCKIAYCAYADRSDVGKIANLIALSKLSPVMQLGQTQLIHMVLRFSVFSI